MPASRAGYLHRPSTSQGGAHGKLARAEGFAVRTRTACYPGEVAFLALYRDGFEGWAKLVIDAATNTLLGATFVGPQFSELAERPPWLSSRRSQSASYVMLSRHTQRSIRFWDPLLAHESELVHY